MKCDPLPWFIRSGRESKDFFATLPNIIHRNTQVKARLFNSSSCWDSSPEPLHEVETEMFGLDHARVGGEVLTPWKLAPHVLSAVRFHDEPGSQQRTDAPGQARWSRLTAVANRFVHAMCLGSSGNEVLDETSDLVHEIGIRGEAIQSVCASVPEQTHELRTIMLSHAHHVPPQGEEGRWSALIGREVHPVYVGATPEKDALAVLVHLLAGRSSSSNPTVAVVRWRPSGPAGSGATPSGLPLVLVGAETAPAEWPEAKVLPSRVHIRSLSEAIGSAIRSIADASS